MSDETTTPPVAPEGAPAATPAPEATPAPRKPAEDWARARGHVQQAKPPAAWVFNATRTRERWVRGELLTEAQYDAAVATTLGTRLG
jgi:hypothetical protein